MKMKLFTAVVAFPLICLCSCKKQEIEATSLASLQVTNVVSGGAELQFANNVATIANNSAVAFAMLAGTQQVKLTSKETPNKVYYDKTYDFLNGGLYSVFLTGTPDFVESVFVKEELRSSYSEDVFGARFINLSKESAPISVNLAGETNGSFISRLEYLSISAFKKVSSVAAEGDKVFEIRNATNGMLITSFTVPGYDMPRFRNITLVFTGVLGSEFLLRVNNY